MLASRGEAARLDGVAKESLHSVRFFDSDDELAEGVSAHLSAGLDAGGAALALVTSEHRGALSPRLKAHGGRLIVLDAGETLSSLLEEGSLDAVCFERFVGSLVRSLADSYAPLHLYGEMVSVLWASGQVPAVVQLEGLWDELVEETGAFLLCGYDARALFSPAERALADEVSLIHSDRSPSERPELRVLAQSFEPEVSAARKARSFTAQALAELGCEDEEDAVFVAGELATNALLYTRSRFSLRVGLSREAIRLGVRDYAELAPGKRGFSPRPGHGLDIVSKIAKAWGVERLCDGKVVWAEL